MKTIVAVILICGLCGAVSASAPCVTGTYQPTLAGYLVQFVVQNDVDGYCGHWSINTADAASVGAPEGWGTYQDFREVRWNATALEVYIGPGESLGGFAYLAQNEPGTLGWWVGTGGYGYNGSVTPTLVPEPSCFAALLSALGGFGVMIRRRRRA